MMGADHGAIDHLKRVRDNPAFVQRLHDLLPQPRQGPAPELAVDAGPLAELFWQVTPRRTGARDPENAIQNKAMVQGFASIRRAHGEDEAFEKPNSSSDIVRSEQFPTS